MSDPPPDSPPRAIPVLLCASTILLLGTALVDPSRLRLLFIPLSLLMSAYGAGTVVRRLDAGPPQAVTAPSLIRTASTLGVGLAALAPVAAFCSMGGWFQSAGSVVVACALYGFWSLSRIERRAPSRDTILVSLAGGTVLGASWLLVWLWATIPPTFYDELTYHLVIPQRALATGKDQLLPWVYHTAMPHASDLLLAWGMAFAGTVGAKATHASFWVVCTMAAWGLAERVAASRATSWAGPLAIIALASSPTLWFLGTLSFSETALTAALATTGCFLLDRPSPRYAWPALGLLLGLAASVKLSGLAWVPAVLVAATLLGWDRRTLAKACLVAALCMAPWWTRAWLGTGNPVFPLASGVFASPYWSGANQARLKGELPLSLQDLGLDALLRLPLDLVQHPERFGSAGDAGTLALAGLGFMAGLPLLARLFAWGEQERRWADAAGALVWLAGSAWAATTMTMRFFAPALVLGLIGLVGLTMRLSRPLRAFAAAGLVILAFAGTSRFIEQQDNAFASSAVAMGRENGDQYLARRLDHDAAARFVRERVPPDARILFVGEARALYFARDGMAPYPVSDHPMTGWVKESGSPEALAQRIADEGFTHVVLNVREFKRLHDQYGLLAFQGPDAPALDHRLKELPRALTPLFSNNGVYVFQVNPVRRHSSATSDKEATP